MDSSVICIFCENGYFAVDNTQDFLAIKEDQFKTAEKTMQLLEGAKDVRLDKFITVVDFRGEALTIIRRTTKEMSQIGIDTTAGGVPPQILGGFVSPDFVVMYVTYAGKNFIQVHMAKTSLKLVAVIDSYVLSYEVLDRVLDKDMFYVYAIQEDQSRVEREKYGIYGRKLMVL